ncbi:Uncharacterised protein [Collinsella intestinalis]|nr:Uncharacterised protein [Collinsella intestinalis]
MVHADGGLLAQLAGKVRPDADHTVTRLAIHLLVVGLKLGPQSRELILDAGLVRQLGEHRANGHHHGEVAHHVRAQFLLRNVLIQVIRLHHDARDAELLVKTANHDLLVHALALAADEVAIEVDIGVVQRLAIGQRHVSVDVIHVEGMRRHGQFMRAQDVRAIAQRVHQQVLIRTEATDIAPREDLLARQGHAVADGGVRALVDFLVHVVGDEQVHAQVALLKATQELQHRGERIRVEPVIGVDDLVVRAARLAQAGTDGHAVPAVLLMHHADDARIAGLPLVGLGAGLVLGAIVHDDDLDIGGALGALENR